MNTAVLDTSVIIKWFYHENEPDLEPALLLREAYLQGELDVIIPDLLIYEFGNFLRFGSGMTTAQMDETMRNLWSLGLAVYPLDESLSQEMARIAGEHDLTVYDAAFLALSKKLSATLVTADRLIHERAGGKNAVVLLSEMQG